MAYILNKTNGGILTTVQDASIDQTTDLKFLGRNYAGYGEFQNENFIRLLENFANTTEPTKPIEGQIWYDAANKKLNVFNASNWKGISNIEITDINPYIDGGKTPSLGDLWYYTAGEQLFAYNGIEYVLIGPPIGADKQAGWRGDYEQSSVEPGTPIYNIKAVIGSEVLAVVSNQEYILNADTSNDYPLLVQTPPLTKLYKGINIIGANTTTGVSATADPVTNAYTSGTLVWGTAAHSIISNYATRAGNFGYTETDVNAYKPVAFLTTSSGNNAIINVDYGLTYNASTNYLKATRFEGIATSALYADLAERYAADDVYMFGTVLVIGGDKEVTVTEERASTAVAGIVSKNPAYMMNSEAGSDETHPYIALKGRVPCQVVGTILKGELLVSSSHCGHAEAFKEGDSPNAVIAKALEDNFEGFAVIEVMVV